MLCSLFSEKVVFSVSGEHVFPIEVRHPFSDKILVTSISGTKVVCFKEGYVAVDIDDVSVAKEILNCSLLSFKLLLMPGIYIPSIREDEIEGVVFDKYLNKYHLGSGYYASFRTVVGMHPEIRADFVPLISVKSQDMKVILELSEKILNSKQKENILTFLECWTERDNESSNTAFILGWVCIEIYLFAQLSDSLGSNAQYALKNGKIQVYKYGRKAGMNKVIDVWEVIVKLKEGLDSGTVHFDATDPIPLTNKILDQMDDVREIRNEIIHGDRKASKDEMKECFDLATFSMQRLMRIGGIRYSDYYNKIWP